MNKEFIYRIAHKYVRKPSLLSKYGFNPYVNEDDGEMVIARPIVLPKDCRIVQHIKKLFEQSHKFWLKDSSRTEEDMHDFDNYTFNEDGTVVMTPELETEWTKSQIGFYANGDKLGRFQLFINDADQNQYYNVIVLNEGANDLVKQLLEDKVIYVAKVKDPNKMKTKTKKDKSKRKIAKQARKKSRKK